MASAVSLNAQKELTGIFKDYFGNKLLIKSDSTFEHTWNFDMQSSWTKGSWIRKGDTILFAIVPIFDTIQVSNDNGTFKDSLVLSLDQMPERTTLRTDVLYGYGQNYHQFPQKLVYKRNRLYSIKPDGSLRREKVKGFWTNKKVPSWFEKLKEPGTAHIIKVIE